VIAYLRRSLHQLIRSERGIALPMALMVTVVGMGLAAVPIVASVNSQSGNRHNQGSNEALAAAEAGAEVALHKQGLLHIAIDNSQLCVAESGASPGWCPLEPRTTNTGTIVPGSIGLASYTYRVLPCYGVGANYEGCNAVTASAECPEDPVQVVATGTARIAGHDVNRRVSVIGCADSTPALPPNWEEEEQTLNSELTTLEEELVTLELPGKSLEATRTTQEEKRTKLEEIIRIEEAEGKQEFEERQRYEEKEVTREVPPPVFSGGQVVGIEGLVMGNNAQVYNGGVGTNGAVSMEGSANVCGTVRYVTTKVARNGSENAPGNCAAGRTFVQSSPVTYPPVQLPAEIATKNSNARLAASDPVPSNVWQRGNISWNESKRELTVSYSELTLEGALPYYLCKLTLAGGSKLRAGSGRSIRIFFDEPKNCSGLNGSAQLQIANGATVYADSNHGPGFYFLGSSEKGKSKIELGGGADVSQFVVYAPRSQIVANNGVNLNGTIIGQSLELQGGAQINKASPFTPPTTTEFVPPEVIKEKVKVALPSEKVETVLHVHKEEKREVENEIVNSTTQIDGINTEPIQEQSTKVSEKSTALAEFRKKIEELAGSAGSGSSFKKSTFTECSAAEPHTTGTPSAGC
jgi:hypothetical protein